MELGSKELMGSANVIYPVFPSDLLFAALNRLLSVVFVIFFLPHELASCFAVPWFDRGAGP
jgi:hypothetical protein